MSAKPKINFWRVWIGKSNECTVLSFGTHYNRTEMNTLFIPLHWIKDTVNHTQSNPPVSWQNKVRDWTPSECCGAAFVEANNVVNKGITMWLSDKAEDCFTDDYIVESVKLVNGDYMHFKINLCVDKDEPEPEEDEEW